MDYFIQCRRLQILACPGFNFVVFARIVKYFGTVTDILPEETVSCEKVVSIA